MKAVALFGGSFNPPHSGHFEMAKYIYETLGVDEVWFLFSENWQKSDRQNDVTKYASVKHRMEMGRIMAQHYPEIPFVMSDIQDQLGTHITYEVLKKLREQFSDTNFIWIMGADNLANFHTWKYSEDIIQNFSIAVVDRSPYTDEALSSPTAIKFPFLKASSPKDLASMSNGWCFLSNPKIDMSSSDILACLHRNETKFNGPFQDVVNYIRQQKLYGVSSDISKQRCDNSRDLKHEY